MDGSLMALIAIAMCNFLVGMPRFLSVLTMN